MEQGAHSNGKAKGEIPRFRSERQAADRSGAIRLYVKIQGVQRDVRGTSGDYPIKHIVKSRHLRVFRDLGPLDAVRPRSRILTFCCGHNLLQVLLALPYHNTIIFVRS